MDNLTDEDFLDALKYYGEGVKLDQLCNYAFAGAEEDEAEPSDLSVPLDGVFNEDDQKNDLDDSAKVDEEADLLEQVLLPGNPRKEAERRSKWLKIQRRARIAIRRMHRNLRHLPKQALIDMLKATKSPKRIHCSQTLPMRNL